MPPPPDGWRPLMRAAYYMMRAFTGEAFSLAMARAAADLEAPPLVAAVLRRIAKDEAAHGTCGWIFFEWAADRFAAEERELLREVARVGVEEIEQIIRGCEGDDDEPTLSLLT